MNQKIYDKISNFAVQKGISIAELERRSGLSNGAIGKWRTVNPTVDNLQAVANALDISIEELLKK